MSKKSGPKQPNWPAKTNDGHKSGGARTNNAPKQSPSKPIPNHPKKG